MYNSTICLLLRDATWLIASLRSSAQLNDLFVNLLSRLDTALGNEPRRNSPCRDAQQLNATICLLLFAPHLAATWLAASRLPATQRFVCYNASPCIAPQHITLLRADQQRNATICLLIYYLVSAQRGVTRLASLPRNSTQRFVCQFIITTRRSALLRHAPRRVSTRRNSTQRTET